MIKPLLLSATLLTAVTAAPTAFAQTQPAQEQSRQTQPVQAPITGIPALSNAKTLRVTQTSYRSNRDHQLVPDMKMTVTFARPNCYRIAAMPFGSEAPHGTKPDMFVTDGSTVTEYVAASNQYMTRTVSTDPRFRLSQVLILDFHGMFSLLGDGFQWLFKPHPGSTLTQTQTQLDGQATRLIQVETPNEPNAHMIYMSSRLWLSSGTGLPVRFESYIVRKKEDSKEEGSKKEGKDHIYQRIDYRDWALDKPVAPSTFAWVPPPSATVYPTDTLLAVGTPAPDFSAVTAQGKVVRLSDFKGKSVILDFWATWCIPCQAAMPHLESVYKQVKNQDVVVLGICVWDSKAAYQKWVADKQATYTFPTLFDTAGEAPSNIAASKYAIRSIPTQYLIDKDGKVAAALGESDSKNDHRLEDALARLGVTVTPETRSASK